GVPGDGADGATGAFGYRRDVRLSLHSGNLLDLHAAHRREAAADVIGPVDIALPHRHAVRKGTALRQLSRIDDLASDHVALEERPHVGVGFPEEARVRRLDPDAMRAV